MTPRLLAQLNRAWWSTLRPPPATPGALARQRDARLRRLVAYAAETAPYYRELFRNLALSPRAIRGADDLPRLPVLEKDTARERRGDFVTRPGGPAACAIRHTSGTTGTHFELPVAPWENLIEAHLWARCYLEGGYRPGRLQARVSWLSRMPRRPYWFQRFGWFRRAYLDGMLPPGEKIAWLRRTRPHTFVCWAGTLDEIAAELERTGEALDIPLVISTCSVLWPHVRRRAEQRVTRRVLETYGAVETGPIAWECERRDGMHVRSDQLIVELLDDDGRPAAQGRVVCTVLWRRVFPLIRYALGDTAEWEAAPCPCGRPGPRLKRITGREEKLLGLPGGQSVSGLMLRTPILDKPGVEQYQLVQDAPARFRFRVLAGPAFTPEIERQVLDEFHQCFAGRLQARLVRVKALRTPPGFKPNPMVTLEYQQRLRDQGVETGVFFDDPPAA